NATSCSSENSVIVVSAVADALLKALAAHGGVVLTPAEARQLEACMFGGGKLSPEVIAKPAPVIAKRAGLNRPELAGARFLIVEEEGVGAKHPFSGEKLSPVLAFYRAQSFDAAAALGERILHHQGAGHSIGLHS